MARPVPFGALGGAGDDEVRPEAAAVDAEPSDLGVGGDQQRQDVEPLWRRVADQECVRACRGRDLGGGFGAVPRMTFHEWFAVGYPSARPA